MEDDFFRPIQVELLAQDREAWKGLISDRMTDLQRYEQQQGHKYGTQRVPHATRNSPRTT